MSIFTPGQEFFRHHIHPDQLGIEVGPWFNPAAPKAAGYRCLSLDIWDREALVARATANPAIPRELIANIEEVDLLGSASDILELAEPHGVTGKVDYIVGSHIIEHIPDPVRFLRSAGQVLRPGGSLLLAVPDSRACFDYFRPHSTTADLLVAYKEKRQRPTLQQIINGHSLSAHRQEGFTFSVDTPWQEIQARQTLEEAYATLRAYMAAPPQEYVDAHCWVFVPASLELILGDLAFLGLVPFDIDFISEPVGCEFFVRLVKPATPRSLNRNDFYKRRDHLLHLIKRQLAASFGAAPATAPSADTDELALITASGQFDAAYYLAHNPDVAAAGADPLKHYLEYGWREGRDPHPDFSTEYYLSTNPDVAAAEVNPLVHYLRHGKAEGRQAKPAPAGQAAEPPKADSILDCYTTSAPTAQGAVDIFAGEWTSRLPGLKSGTIELFNDDRVIWGCGTLGGVEGQRVLELGPLEGAHTHTLLKRMGCREVVAVEANARAYLKCLVTKEIFGMTEAHFHYGDAIAFLENSKKRFDLIFASGILYHMREPLKLLSLIAGHTDRCVIWTHYYDAGVLNARPELQGRFSPAGTTSWNGLTAPVWRFEYQEALQSQQFCGGGAPYALWLERQTILDVLDRLGFKRIEINHDNPTHPNGPSFTLAVSRA